MQEIQCNNRPRTFKKPLLNFIDYVSLSFIVVVFCVLVIFCYFWLQASNSFFFFTIPRVITYILNPKVLFVLTNVIVITLIGESRFSRSRPSHPASELGKEYNMRSHSCGSCSHENMKMKIGYQKFLKENIDLPRLEEDKRGKLSPLQLDSLNQRADDLIARVNRQRRLEIGLLHSHIGHSRITY
ncbi:hypothetical protein V5N11_033078 [Cardamine amara subsp. amara]|uniref:DUF4408 domain-containing protein n=1 Tax=Cardamine amara subsp. amara TaxID=228776 RepID=A0ABD1BNM1_CARAN